MKHKRSRARKKIRGSKSRHTWTYPYLIALFIAYIIEGLGLRYESTPAMICGAVGIAVSVWQYLNIEYRNRERMDRLAEKYRELSKRKDECEEFLRGYHRRIPEPEPEYHQTIRSKVIQIGSDGRKVLRDEKIEKAV